MTFINWEDLPFEEDLTISGFTTIKSRIKHYNDQNHTRAVWENKEKGVILKIWPKNYIRGEYFHQAYKSGFFNDMEDYSSIQVIIIKSTPSSTKSNPGINGRSFPITWPASRRNRV